MGAFGTSYHRSPSIGREGIILFLDRAIFYEADTSKAEATLFFEKSSDMYQEYFFSRICCENHEKFRQCTGWLGIEIMDNEKVVTDFFPDSFSFQKGYRSIDYPINSVIHALLRNSSLMNIDDFNHMTSNYVSEEEFNQFTFTEVNPYALDGELAEIALQNSLHFNWPHSPMETKQLTLDFVNQITEGRYKDFKIYRTEDHWNSNTSSFFICYFIFDMGKGELWLLLKDDYD